MSDIHAPHGACVNIQQPSEFQVLNHRQLDNFFNTLTKLTAKETSKNCITDPFVRGIDRSPVDFHHKGPVMRTALPCHDIVRMLSLHYHDVIMDAMASQITRLTIVYSIVYSGADQGKHQSPASLAFVRGIHR